MRGEAGRRNVHVGHRDLPGLLQRLPQPGGGAAQDGRGVARRGYGRHLGEPYWEEFIRELLAASPEFAELWAQQDVAAHSSRSKTFRHASVGEIRLAATNLGVTGMPEARMVVYTPVDEESRESIAWLMANPGAPASRPHPRTGRGRR